MSAPPLLSAYAPPALRIGDRVYCIYRRAWCRVSSFSSAPIQWAAR